MPKTYYDSELTAAEIESVLKAIHNVISPSNNGKILAIESGRFVAKSASEYSGDAVLEPLNVSANGDYYPRSGTDGFSEAHITVPSYPEPTGTINITSNGTVNVKDYAEANVQVPGGGSNIEVIPLSVTANDTYTAPAGKAYSPVTVNVSGGGGTVNWKTQSQWDAMTFAQKKQQGLTLIGTPGSMSGQYFDYANVVNEYYLEANNIITLNNGADFGFHAFYSHASGDRASAGGRGVTWNTDGYRVICNALPVNGGFGFYCAFALTQEALAGTNAQYYSIMPVNGYNMFCAGNMSGAWMNNADVTFVYNGTTNNLQSMYNLNEYTIRFDTYPSSSATFNSDYDAVLSSIYAFLSDYS